MLRKASQKGGVEVDSILLVGGVVVVIMVVAWATIKWTDLTHGACVSGLQATVLEVQAKIGELKNDGDKPVKIPVTLKDCANSLVFANRGEFEKVLIKSNMDLVCVEGYEGLIIGVPEEKNEGWWGALKKTAKGDIPAAIKEIATAKIEGLQLKPFCKNLLRKEYKFNEKYEIKESNKEERYCLTFSREKGGIFSVGKKIVTTDNEYNNCENS